MALIIVVGLVLGLRAPRETPQPQSATQQPAKQLRTTESVQEIPTPKPLPLEDIIKKRGEALVHKNPGAIWEFLHPDDKARWVNKEEYVSSFNRRASLANFVSVKTKETKQLSSWTHSVTKKTYNDVKEVVSLYTIQNVRQPIESLVHYQQVDGGWYVFTKTLSSQDGERIKEGARTDISYSELRRNVQQFSGEWARFDGKVLEVPAGENYLRLEISKDGFGDETIWVDYFVDIPKITGDDIVTVYGILASEITYESLLGSITIPRMEAALVEKGGVSLRRVEGLTAIEVGGGSWENWDADVEKDGPVIRIEYKHNNGNFIESHATKVMPISADVKIYAGTSSISPKNRLVFSGHYDTEQIIFAGSSPRVRISKENMNVNRQTDYKYGTVTLTISTPEQGQFSDENDLISLYE